LCRRVIIYFTLICANRLVNNKKLMKVIDIFGVIFLVVLAYSFYSPSSGSAVNRNYLEKYVSYSPFLIGLMLSSLNFLQLPFWTGWKLYLGNGDYIKIRKFLRFYYLAGTLTVTFRNGWTFIFPAFPFSKCRKFFKILQGSNYSRIFHSFG
jgi:hypothetical protein